MPTSQRVTIRATVEQYGDLTTSLVKAGISFDGRKLNGNGTITFRLHDGHDILRVRRILRAMDLTEA